MKILIYSLLVFPVFIHSHRTTLTFGRPPKGFLQEPAADNYTISEEKYMIYSNITQKVDHFNTNNNDTWLQRYQYNRKFFDQKKGIVFLMLGGEGQINDKWVRNENVSMMQWAREYGAAAFQLEHRFYGPRGNSPYNSQTTQNMKLLTISQALADIAEFIKQMKTLYFKGQKTYWVTFGGSYPGSLSAFFRETYPDLTIGAVSTSSAVHVFVDYYGYAVNTENNYRSVDTLCAEQIRKGFQDMINLAYGGVAGRQQLKNIFDLCDSFDETKITKSVQFFFQNIYGVFQGINQYSGDNREPASLGLGVPNACAIMTNGTNAIHNIKSVWDYYNSFNHASGCNDNSYDQFIKRYGDTSYSDDEDVVATRSWIWQTCTELGYFQTTDGGNKGIFGSTVPLDFFVDQCIDLFGPEYNLESIFRSVAEVKAKFGTPDAYRGTKVVFPNGSFDPWKSLGLLEQYSDKNNGIDAFMINGTAHCADMYPARGSDLPSLVAGRERIRKNLDSWIKDALTKGSSSVFNNIVIYVIAMLVIRMM